MADAHLFSHLPESFRTVLSGVNELEKAAKMARKYRFRLDGDNHYARKARTALASVKRNVAILRKQLPVHATDAAAIHLQKLMETMDSASLNGDVSAIVRLAQDIRFRLETDVAAILQITNDADDQGPFLPAEIVPASVYRRIVEEVNRTHKSKCYNGCAALIRRLTESLIIEAFEVHGIEGKIKTSNGEYLELNALIAKAASEPVLRLSRNTRGALPNLKLLGDLSLHSRRHFIVEGDLERIYNPARIALQELASHIKG